MFSYKKPAPVPMTSPAPIPVIDLLIGATPEVLIGGVLVRKLPKFEIYQLGDKFYLLSTDPINGYHIKAGFFRTSATAERLASFAPMLLGFL